MKIINRTSFPILANCFAVGKFGPERMVMHGETGIIPGPLIIESPDGNIYMTVEGIFTVVENGQPEPKSGILVVTLNRRCSHVWETPQGREGVIVRHFRFDEANP